MRRREFFKALGIGVTALVVLPALGPAKVPELCRCGKPMKPPYDRQKEDVIKQLLQNAIESHDLLIEQAIFNGITL